MLREIIVLKGKHVVFKHEYGRTLSWEALSPIINSLIDFITTEKRNEEITDFMNIVNYKLAYLYEPNYSILIIFITDLTDKEDDIKTQIGIFKTSFIQSFAEYLSQNIIDPEYYKTTKYICDEIIKELRPKIALIGFSGVGKTTITKLIRAEDIPMKHIPTITGDVAAIKVGDLPMYCWDFAGQEQFSFIWSRFVKGSDAIILVVDSTKQNLRESKFFVDLIKKEAPKTRVAIVANKQDLPGALSPEEIANTLGYRTYPLIAIDPEQRSVMLNIIAEVVEVTSGTTKLIQPMLERDRLVEVAEAAIMQGNILKAAETYKRIGDLSQQLGEDQLAAYFYEQSKMLAQHLQSVAQTVMDNKPIDKLKPSGVVPQRVEVIEQSSEANTTATDSVPTVQEPASSAQQTPAPPAQQTPAPPVQQTPAPPAQQTPAPPAQQTPAPPAQQTPAPPAQQTPAPPVQQTPAPPVQQTPAPPAQQTPAPSITQEVNPSASSFQTQESEIKQGGISEASGTTTTETEEVDEKAQIAKLEEKLKEINAKIDEIKANAQNYDPEDFKKLMMDYEDKKNKIHRKIMDLRMEIIKKLTL